MTVTHGHGASRLVAYNTLVQVVGRVVSMALAVMTLRLTTTYLGPTPYGAVVTATALLTLFSTVTDWGLTTIAGRDMSRRPEQAEEILGLNLAMRLVASVVVTPFVVLVGFLIYRAHDATVRQAIAVMSVTLIFTSVQATLTAVFVARVRNDLTAAIEVITRLALLVALIVIIRLDSGYMGYLVATVALSVFGCLLTYPLARRYLRIRWLFAPRRWLEQWRVALPLGIVQAVNVVYYKIDSLLLSLLRDPTQVGYYGVAYRVVDLIMAVPGFFMLALLPSLASADHERLRHLTQQAFDVLVVLAVAILAVGIPLSRGVVLAAAGREFISAGAPLAVLLIGAAASYVNAVYGNSLVAIDEQRRLVGLTIGLTTFNIVLNIVLIPVFGLVGAAAATSCSELLSMLIVVRLFRRATGLTLRYSAVARCLVAGGVTVLAWILATRLHVVATTPGVVATVFTGAGLLGVYVAVLALVRGLPIAALLSALRGQ
jgi:O-antigen/teichoic acid export membrane protein